MDVGAISFLQLPVEILCDVLQVLSVKDLLQCNLVCKRLRRIINESSALQFIIELARCRMKPAPTSKLPISSRLRILRDRENAWRTFSPKSQHKLKLNHSGTVYEFTGGFYGIGKEIDRRTAYITFYDLHSVMSGAQRSITHTFTDVNVIDFTMDPAQDLLVLVSMNEELVPIPKDAATSSPYLYDLHLRTLSLNEPHPLAPSPILPCYRKLPGLNLTEGAVQIQISGDVVGFLVKEALLSQRAHFEVFKWQAVSPNSCMVKSLFGIDDFTFLSEDHFLLVEPNGLFDVYSFSDSISDPTNPILRACYELPMLSPAYSFWYISLSSNPSPRFPGPTGEEKTYHCSPADRLHACCIYVYQSALPNRDTVYPFVFFFHPDTLLNPPLPRKPSSGNAGIDIFSTWQGPNAIEASSPSTLDYNSPVLSDLVSSSASSAPSSPQLGSSASSVSSDDTSHNLLNFPTPRAIYAGSSSMLFDTSPSTSGRATPSSTQSRIPIPWEAWGPQNTRWFLEHLSKDWQRSIYGLRTADCVVDRAALEGLLHRDDSRDLNGNSEYRHGDSDSDNEDNGGDESDEDEDAFIFDEAAGDIESQLGCTSTLPKFLRIRDFNPYSISKALEEEEEIPGTQDPPLPRTPCSPSYDVQEIGGCSPDMIRDRGGYRRVVNGPTKVNVRGVFRENIVSCLPYVEVISKDTFNVNEIMMDDCRLLLIKRGRGQKLKTINVLTM
ncbi:hypothetical protein F5877DRAFT_65816 [Lentinula edodes]|nr:hypothetical protein F5877DRAFT_65816 [Lentinula edodes]